MDKVLKNKKNIITIFKNKKISKPKLEEYLGTELSNEVINELLFLINNIVKSDSSVDIEENIINMLDYIKCLLDENENINKKAIERKVRKIEESLNTYLQEAKFTPHRKEEYIALKNNITPYLDSLTIVKKKEISHNELLYQLIYNVKNIEYIKLSLDVLNITSTPQFEGKTLLETIVITYASKLDKIDIMLDEVRYYDTVIKMLIENELSNISYEDKKKALSYLKKTKYTLKSKDRLGREKTKYISALIEYLKENVNGDKYLDELSKRYSVNIKKADGPTLGDINPYINNRVISNDFIISIDNSCTGEIDDAISCKRLPNGNYLLGIHITDIFGYFNINSAIVKEAYDKVTTIYSNGLFIPMFPMNIAIDQASLIENRPRYADSHYYEITKHGEVVSDIIMPTIITNNKKLNYEQANKIIKEDKSRNEELLTTIESLIEVEDILQRKFQTSSLYLSNKVNTLDPSCSKVGQSAAEKIVLYTMLLENSNMAEYFYKNNYPLIYRTHSFETNYEQEKENILKQLNMIGTDDIDKFIKSLIDIKPQSTYAISGSHEGLGLKHYCHSTSPERRFADLWNRYLNKRCRMENSNDPDIYKLEKETKRVIERINEQLIHINSFSIDYNEYLRKNKQKIKTK